MRKYLVLTTLLSTLGFIQLSPAATWTIEKVTDNTETDVQPVVAAVSSGLMVVYDHNDGDDEVFIANNFSGSWTSSRITDNTNNDVGCDIAARYNEQTAHIAIEWDDTPDGEISYYSGIPGSWNTQRVTDDADNDQFPSLAIDKNGCIHMTFCKSLGDAEIFYANNVSGSWVSEQVTDNGTPDGFPWLALDSDGNPHVVYTDLTNLWYQKKVAGIWTDRELVATGIAFGLSYPFLVIDRDDHCHVTYAKSDGDLEVHYANNVTGTWQEAKVTSNDYLDALPTLIVDPNNKIHIAYVTTEGGTDAEVFYANNVAGIWSIGRVTDNSVDDVIIFGRNFTADQNRIGHIFFTNASDGDNEIYHAYSNEPLFAGVEETTPVSSPVSIELGHGVISTTVNYSVPSTGNVSLKVYDVSGSLVKTLVDGTQPQGEYTVTWGGGTNSGVHAALGIYFYRLTAAGQTASVKGILK